MNDILNKYNLETLFQLEKVTETPQDYEIETPYCDEKNLVALHNKTKLQFPSYLLRFHSYNKVNLLDEKTLCVIMESGSDNAYGELKSRYEAGIGNIYNATDEFLAIAARKGKGLELDILTETHEPIINKLINRVDRRYFFRGQEKDDLLQEAFIGYLKAIEVFKVERRTKFKDFSRYVIERHLGTLMNRSKNLRNRALNDSVSYNMPVNTNNETTFEDLLEGIPIIPENIYLNVETCKEITGTLTENELDVLYPYSEGYSYEEIAFMITNKKGLVDLSDFTYEKLMTEIEKNELYLGTKQVTYNSIAEKVTEAESPYAVKMKTFQDLVDDIKCNLEYENSQGMTIKMIAAEIKRRRKSVDNTIQRIRKKGGKTAGYTIH